MNGLDCSESARLVWLGLVDGIRGVEVPLMLLTGSIEVDAPLFDVRFFPHERRSLPEILDGNDSENIATESRRTGAYGVR